jgi:ArsR family transcriptional regulator, virulence genes transcriptional regulator
MPQRIAEFMKIFSNPVRVKIIFTLSNFEEKTVNRLVMELAAKQCYVSQQLAYLTEKGILARRKNSHNVYYSLRNRDILNLLELAGSEIKINNAEVELQVVNK